SVALARGLASRVSPLLDRSRSRASQAPCAESSGSSWTRVGEMQQTCQVWLYNTREPGEGGRQRGRPSQKADNDVSRGEVKRRPDGQPARGRHRHQWSPYSPQSTKHPGAAFEPCPQPLDSRRVKWCALEDSNL